MRDKPSGPAPGEAALHEAALNYLARYSATRVTLTRVLNKKVDRWARATEGEDVSALAAVARAAVRDVVAKLAASGVVNDVAFAETRARRLTRTGRSRRATAAHLASRGVASQAVKAALPDNEAEEFAAAVAFARRRRFGPFRRAEVDADERRRELVAFARAGFAQDAARRALSLSPDEAEAVLAELRRD